jgi:hypothetical protein
MSGEDPNRSDNEGNMELSDSHHDKDAGKEETGKDVDHYDEIAGHYDHTAPHYDTTWHADDWIPSKEGPPHQDSRTEHDDHPGGHGDMIQAPPSSLADISDHEIDLLSEDLQRIKDKLDNLQKRRMTFRKGRTGWSPDEKSTR